MKIKFILWEVWVKPYVKGKGKKKEKIYKVWEEVKQNVK